jgi:hypothetical protein
MMETDAPAAVADRQIEGGRWSSETELRLSYRRIDEWPPLAWLAVLPGDRADTIEVLHGPWVETLPQGFCEAVWPGDFEAFDFDRTEIVAGTGMRLRDRQAIFVSSASTVDRLQSVTLDGRTLVSNSLACLVACGDIEVDPAYKNYYRLFFSVIDGLDEYERFIKTPNGMIRLSYFNNLVWNGRDLQEIAKPSIPIELRCFSDYRNFLEDTFCGIAQNMNSPSRKQRYTFLGTQSSGYDSTTITSIARDHGLRQVICFELANNDRLEDSGVAIAQHLGVEPIVVDPRAWRRTPFAEVPFVAGNCFGEEVHYKAAEAELHGRVLLTGYHGDKLWALSAKTPSTRIVRGDPSGGALTEYRLWAGFIHCPVPFWLARRHPEIAQLGRLPEMAPWDIGGDYNRPLCRRIAEEAGVPRESFGVRKTAASRWPHYDIRFGTPEGLDAFCRWLRGQWRRWIARGRVPPIAYPLADYRITKLRHVIDGILRWVFGHVPLAHRSRILQRLGNRMGESPWIPGARRYVFPWALAEATKRYRVPPFRAQETRDQP